MSPGIGVGVGPPFVHLRRRSSSILDQLFGGGQGMYAVAGLREGSGAWTDQTGGGRHLTLPGGSADPIQLDHDGTDYFYFPGTTGNTLTVPGLSNSTAYDYKVWYEDATTATGEETTDGSGVLTLGGTQTNFDAKSVTRIRVVADGDDPDVDTAVADILASDADEDSSTFTEASANAATVTINRSASGYPLMVVQRPWSLGAVDDYLTLTDDALWDIAADEDFTLLVTGVRYTGLGHIAYRGSNSFADGYGMSISTGTTCKYRVDDGPNAAQGTTSVTYSERHTWALRLDRTTDLLTLFEDGSVIGTPVSTASVGAITGGDQPLNILGGSSVGTEFSRMAVCAVAFTKRALTADEITASAVAMLALNGG